MLLYIVGRMYNDNDYYNIETYSDMDTIEYQEHKRELKEMLRQIDNQYEKYKVKLNMTWKDGKFYKKVNIVNYGSRGHGALIRNAVTGVRYKIRVGSEQEGLFFKVTEATGRRGRQYQLMLYYDSPEQYENHHFKIVDPKTKEAWRKRVESIQNKMATKRASN